MKQNQVYKLEAKVEQERSCGTRGWCNFARDRWEKMQAESEVQQKS